MARAPRAAVLLAAVALVAGGLVYFCAALGVIPRDAGPTALLVVAGVLLIALAAIVDPAWLLSAGIASTMFAGHWDELGLSSAVGPHRVLLAVGLLAVLLRAPPARNRPGIRLGRVHLVLAAALAYALISAVAVETLGRRDAQFTLIDEFGALPFLMFLVAPVAFATERQRRILLGTLVGMGAYLAITALFEKLKLTGLIVPSYINDPTVGTHFGRARGPFVEAAANGLALYASGVAAAIALAVWRHPAARAAAAAVLALAPVALLLTVTRSVWLAGIVATLVAIATTPKLWRVLVPAAVAGAAAVLAAFALIPGVAQQARERQSDKAPVYERENTTRAGLRMIADRPLIGFGWDRANDDIDPYFRLDPDIPLTGARAGFHNLYLQYGVSLGLLGLALWLTGAALAFGAAFTRRGPPELDPWRTGLKAILVAWVIVGLSTPASYIFSTILLWTWAGVAWGGYPVTRRAPRPAAGPTGTTAEAGSGNGRRIAAGTGLHP